jgi:AcrR family transcriptional regulator
VVDVLGVDRAFREVNVTGLQGLEMRVSQGGRIHNDWTHGLIIYYWGMIRKASVANSSPRRFPRREEAARVTRNRLVQAAAELFVEQGYLATSISAIAARAGVGRATVFTSVPGGKPELLKLARDIALAGDDDPVPMPERAWFRHAMAADNARELIKRQSHNYRMIQQRAAKLEQALVIGAAETPELAELERAARSERAKGASLVISRLVQLRAIPHARAQRASDTLYALASPTVYLMLTQDRNWTGSQYERWLTATLTSALLR